MTCTCLINNYNYGRFVGEAVESALVQTVPLDEIIVVDDGSTDGSVELLTSRFGRHPQVQIVAKDNRGQLSCFNEGFARSRGDIVFFLDADDLFEPNYVEESLAAYDRDRSCDFVFCGRRKFGQTESVELEFAEDRDLGYSVVLAAHLRKWIGGPTSCLSMRRGVLEKILPLPLVDDWRIRADDCLIFGASLAGAKKYFIAQPLVRYRVHGDNYHCNRKPDKFAVYRRQLAINALFGHLERRLCYNVGRLAEFHHREFCTIDRPTFRQLMQYVRIGSTSRVSPYRQMACMAKMTAHFVRSATRPAGNGTNGPLSAHQRPDAATKPRVHPQGLKQAA